MAVRTTRPTIGATPTAISGADTDDSYGSSIIVTNKGATSIYLGAGDVTTSTGWELAAGDTVSMELTARDPLFGVVATGTETAHVLELGVTT